MPPSVLKTTFTIQIFVYDFRNFNCIHQQEKDDLDVTLVYRERYLEAIDIKMGVFGKATSRWTWQLIAGVQQPSLQELRQPDKFILSEYNIFDI